MLTYIIRRVLWMFPTMLGITMIVLAAIHVAPGDPATVMVGVAGGAGEMSDEGSDLEARIEEFRKKHALDRNFFVQYLGFIGPFNVKPDGHRWFGGSDQNPWGGLLAGDLGTELLNKNKSVAGELVERLKVTVPLALISVLITYLLAIPLGIFSANRQGTVADQGMTTVLFILYSIPLFWAGLMLQLFFGKGMLDCLPVLGLETIAMQDATFFEWFWDRFLHSILPVATLSYGGLAYLSRQMRAGMIDVIHQDYIRTARAKGLSEKAVVFKHALRNSLIPVITIFASILPILIGGSVVVEYVFDLPGMGEYAYSGLLNRDYNIIMATVTFSAFMTLIGILLSDIAYAFVDPRISYS